MQKKLRAPLPSSIIHVGPPPRRIPGSATDAMITLPGEYVLVRKVKEWCVCARVCVCVCVCNAHPLHALLSHVQEG